MNKINFHLAIVSSLFTMILVGCGGGGGGGSDSAAPPPVSPGVQMIAQEATYTFDGVTYTNVTDERKSTTGTASISYRLDGTIDQIAISTPTGTVVWDEANNDIIDDSDVVVTLTNESESDIGIIVNAKDPNINWQYQTFGVWETGRNPNGGPQSGTFGAATMSLLPTTGSAIPITGSATFTGLAGGVYVDATGTNDYITGSVMSANVNFLKQSIALSTTDTRKVNTVTSDASLAPELNISGTLSYTAGINSFAGTVSTPNAGLTGPSSGQFYGPNAEEIGGVFLLKGQGVETYIGGYGGAKQ